MEMKNVVVYRKEDFRKWLARHHDREHKVAVILYKKHTGKKASSHRELIEEAIAYGWIDTTVKTLDEDRYIRTFSRRNKNSTWSDNTLRYARQLIKEGRMTPAGMEFYTLGKAKPTLDAGIPKNPAMPSELKAVLAKDTKAKALFAGLSPSVKKMLYRWLLSGKRPETREKRIGRILDSVKTGKKIF